MGRGARLARGVTRGVAGVILFCFAVQYLLPADGGGRIMIQIYRHGLRLDRSIENGHGVFWGQQFKWGVGVLGEQEFRWWNEWRSNGGTGVGRRGLEKGRDWDFRGG